MQLIVTLSCAFEASDRNIWSPLNNISYMLPCLLCIYGDIGDKVPPENVRGKAIEVKRGGILTVNEHDTYLLVQSRLLKCTPGENAIKDECENRSSCSLKATHEIYGDPSTCTASIYTCGSINDHFKYQYPLILFL